ncbi:hypothetical protein [Paraherbaspirillum soli]|uniref:Uncharacterized protein n=1 Tax=Paraherbaspirillum soli TaxID=631222 RepID=A0ABW0MGJ2_9BURK
MTYARKPDQTTIFPPEIGSHEEALHKPFSWLVAALQHDPAAQFTSFTKNYSYGIRTCMEMVHATDLASGDHADPSHPPLLSVTAREELMLFSIEALGTLGDRASEEIERLNQKHAKGAR